MTRIQFITALTSVDLMFVASTMVLAALCEVSSNRWLHTGFGASAAGATIGCLLLAGVLMAPM